MRATPGRAQELRDTFFVLYQREAQPVTAFVRAAMPGAADADDVAADVFCNAWNAWGRFRGDDAAARAWLFRIARNRIADHWRRGSRVRLVEIDEAAGLAVEPEPERWADLRAALGTLGRADRELLALRSAGLSHAEIAAVQERSETAVKTAWHRALGRLRVALEAQA